jgi:glycosyltransferase involved in cell wall biosynthesis
MDTSDRMNNKILVSVVMLTYNRTTLIVESIKSVLEQSYQRIELLIIDDGSIDNTNELIRSFANPCINYFFFEHTGHISYLRNFGMHQAKGDFIAFIDSDDLWRKDKIQSQVEILTNNPDVGFTFSDIEEFSTNHSVKNKLYHSMFKKEHFFMGNVFSELISNKMSIYPSSVMFRKSCLHKTGSIDETFRSGENNFLIRLAFNFDTFIVSDCLTSIRKHEGNISSVMQFEAFQEMSATIQFFYDKGTINEKIANDSFVSLQYGLAMDLWRRKEFKRCRVELRFCVQRKPFFLNAWVRYFLSYLKHA